MYHLNVIKQLKLLLESLFFIIFHLTFTFLKEHCRSCKWLLLHVTVPNYIKATIVQLWGGGRTPIVVLDLHMTYMLLNVNS